MRVEVSAKRGLLAFVVAVGRPRMARVVLNVGLDLRVISPTLFAMFAMMAVRTTFATLPALSLVERSARDGVARGSDPASLAPCPALVGP